MTKVYRVGQIVPSSNTTMETEIPAMLRARESICPERFTFHSSRMRMKTVSKDELTAMDGESDRCALELSDASVDVMGYACLVAIMAMGPGYHRQSESRLRQRTIDNEMETPIVTSAGALVEGIKTLGAKKIALVTPYMKPLTELVVEYIRNEDIQVLDYRSLEIPNNLDVARHDPMNLPDIVDTMNLEDVDAIVLSACVQMPSLPAIPLVEARTGKPVLTAAVATTYQLLKELKLRPVAPGAGTLLSGAY
ncbi:MAG: maleate cis-trans isomerase family protein [Endozoicomonas sp.]